MGTAFVFELALNYRRPLSFSLPYDFLRLLAWLLLLHLWSGCTHHEVRGLLVYFAVNLFLDLLYGHLQSKIFLADFINRQSWLNRSLHYYYAFLMSHILFCLLLSLNYLRLSSPQALSGIYPSNCVSAYFWTLFASHRTRGLTKRSLYSDWTFKTAAMLLLNQDRACTFRYCRSRTNLPHQVSSYDFSANRCYLVKDHYLDASF